MLEHPNPKRIMTVQETYLIKLPTKDVRVEKLMKLDKDWYGNQMLKVLVQACGRGVRSEDDYCETYILDGSIFDAINRNKKKLPKFFLDRFN
jgi:Rad3-related DNA helicase